MQEKNVDEQPRPAPTVWTDLRWDRLLASLIACLLTAALVGGWLGVTAVFAVKTFRALGGEN